MTEDTIHAYLTDQYPAMLELLRNLVIYEGCSKEVEQVTRLAEHLDTYLNALGMQTEKTTFPAAAPAIYARTRNEGSLPAVLLAAHMDTVHPVGAFGSIPFRQEGDWLYGPGVYDCKGGIVVAIMVIKTLQMLGYNKRQLKLVLVGDEEVAHGLSRNAAVEVYYRACEHTACAFNCESGDLSGEVVTRRKGGGVFKVIIDGREAHAGVAPWKGASAIREAAQKIEAIEALNGDYKDVFYNVGAVSGGQGANIVPQHAEFTIGVRYETNAQYEACREKLAAIVSRNHKPEIKAQLQELAGFKAMELTPKTAALLDIFGDACEAVGKKRPQGMYVGGCSDAAYIAAKGVPVLCAAGIEGENNHALTERAYGPSLITSVERIVRTILALPDNF